MVKNPPATQGIQKTWVPSGRSPGEGTGGPPVFLPGVSHGRRSLAGCNPQGHTGWRRLSNFAFTPALPWAQLRWKESREVNMARKAATGAQSCLRADARGGEDAQGAEACCRDTRGATLRADARGGEATLGVERTLGVQRLAAETPEEPL